MSAATVSRGARRFLLAGLGFLVAWQATALAGAPRGVGVVLGLHGFVLHTVAGKAYSLVPSYFDRELAFPRAPAVTLPATALGVVGMASVEYARLSEPVELVATTLWALGFLGILATLGWTVRTNLTGAETGTGEHNADRRTVDRVANAFVVVALGYLLAGTYVTAAVELGLPTPVVYGPATSHLLAVGGATLLLFAVGFRLLPRFLAARPPRPLVAVVLPAAAVGPWLLATGLPAGTRLQWGAVVESVAVLGFALALAVTVRRSDKRRVGFAGFLSGVGLGAVGVGLGLAFAYVAATSGLVRAHLRVNLLGLLGLSILGATYQFYPPAVSSRRWVGERTALVAMTLVAAGLLAEVVGAATGPAVAVTAGRVATLGGVLLHAGVVVSLFAERYW
jgi:hypothetical protein